MTPTIFILLAAATLLLLLLLGMTLRCLILIDVMKDTMRGELPSPWFCGGCMRKLSAPPETAQMLCDECEAWRLK